MKLIKVLSVFILLLSFSSCATTTIPNSQEAKAKLEDLGYTVQMFTQYGDDVSTMGITQVTVLYADKGEDSLSVYFFANAEDTKTFFRDRARSISKDVEIAKKNKYSIYAGSKNAVEDFLS